MIKLLKHILAFSIIIICYVGCQTEQSKTTKNETETEQKVQYKIPEATAINNSEKNTIKNAVQVFYDSVLAPSGFNGGILVAKGGNIVFQKYKGSINLDGLDSVTAKTPLHIASVSKTFTAMTILQLQQQKKLAITDSVSKYFPQFNYKGITIQSLLTHRSGLPNYLYFMDKLGWPKDSMIQNTDVLQWLIQKKDLIQDIGAPNIKFTYCNTNYALLALIIEKVTGTSYPQYIQQHIFDAIGMKNSFVYHKADKHVRSKSFDWKGRNIADTNLDEVYGDKNIYSTVEDLLLWDRVLRDTVFLKPNLLALAYQPYSNEKPGIKNYGFGWRMNIYPNNKKIIFHTGWWHGNTAMFMRLLDTDVTIIAISNRLARQVYATKLLVNNFGNYFEVETDDVENTATTIPEVVPNVKKTKKQKISSKIIDLYKNKKRE